MSVVSERSGRRGPPNRNPRVGMLRGRGYSQSEIDSPFIVPHFSAIASEGVKMNFGGRDEWTENTTVVTGNTSEHSYSGGDAVRAFESVTTGRAAVARRCSRLLWLFTAGVLSFAAVTSPAAMAAVPFGLRRFGYDFPEPVCDVACQGYLLKLAINTFLLIFALFAMYWRRASADLPRLYLARAAFALFVLFVLFSFWLFYTVRIILERHPSYDYVVSFALSLLDALLYIHYISVIVLELRKLRPEFVITVVRDPDGESKTFNIGMMSVQEAALQVLRFYETSFPSFNYQLDKARNTTTSRFRNGPQGLPGFKVYDIEGLGGGEGTTLSEASARALMEAAARRRAGGHNNDVYENELAWDNRIRKRRCRLIGAAEDAFAQVGTCTGRNQQKPIAEPMDSLTAAQNVFTWIMRPLNKFLKLTRQQHRHPADRVTAHIERCLSLRLSHRTFLQRFISDRFPSLDVVGESKWSIVSDEQASVGVAHGVVFLLRCHNREGSDAGVQLLCSVAALPFFNLTEQSRQTNAKFSLRISSASAV